MSAGRTPACEDADFIARRLAELDIERRAAFACCCNEVTDNQGHKALSLSPSCPIHRIEPSAPADAVTVTEGFA